MPIESGLITCKGYVGSLYTLKDGTMKLTLEIDRKEFLKEIHAIDELFQQQVVIHIQDYQLFVTPQDKKEEPEAIRNRDEEQESYFDVPKWIAPRSYEGPADGSEIDLILPEAEQDSMSKMESLNQDQDNKEFYTEMLKAGITRKQTTIEEYEAEQAESLPEITIPENELTTHCPVLEVTEQEEMNQKRSTAYKHLLYAGMADKRATILMCIYGKSSMKELDKEELDQFISFLSDGGCKVLNYLPIRQKLMQIYETKSTKGIF